MLDYYCYVYYDADWIAYYVGKGSKQRADYRNDDILVPTNEYIQKFYFNLEWEAYECEIELINFWGRQLDGGSLFNKALGGAGASGVLRTDAQKLKQSLARKSDPRLAQIIEKCTQATRTPITLVSVEGGIERTFISVQEASRQLGLNPSHVSSVRHGKRKSHKGWTVK